MESLSSGKLHLALKRLMAGGEFKIENLIDKSIFEDLKRIAEESEKTAKGYSKLCNALSMTSRLNPSSLSDFTKKVNDAEKAIGELHEAQNKLSELQQAQRDILKDVSKALSDEAKAAKQAADAIIAEGKADRERERLARKQKVTAKEALEISKKQVKSIEEASAANSKLRKAVKQITDAEDKHGKIRKQLNDAIDKNTAYIQKHSDSLVRAKNTVGQYREQIKLAFNDMSKGKDVFQNFGKMASGIGGMLKVAVILQAAQAVSKLFQSLKEGAKTAMEFEKANSNLAAVLGTTAEGIKELQVQARQLGATTKYTAAEATNLQVELAKLGFTAQEIKNATPAILRFAQATGAELAEAAALSGASLRMFNATSEETERYTAAMAVSTARSAASFSKLATALPIVGPVANAFNFTIEDTLALLGKLFDAGFDASMAATATRNILLNLADANGVLAKQLGEPVKNLPDLVKGLQKLKAAGVDLNSTLEMTDKRSVAAFSSFLTAADKILPLREAVTDAEQGMKDMAETMSNNTAGALKTLDSAWEELMISIYGNTGIIRTGVEWITKTVRALGELFESIEAMQIRMTQVEESKGLERAAVRLEQYEESIFHIQQLYIKKGKSNDEALLLAKQSYIDGLKKQLESERASLSSHVQERKAIQDKMAWYNRAYLVEQADGTFKTYAQMEKDQTEYIAVTKGNIAEIEKLIEGVSNIGTTEEKNNGKNGNIILTEKEKKAQEKAAKEKLKIEKSYQEAKVSLMDEGLEKEIEQIRNNYTAKIAAIMGNSEMEKQTRLMLAEKMQQEIADKELEYKIAEEKIKTQSAMVAAKKGSDEILELRLKLADQSYEAELAQAKGDANKIALAEKNKRVAIIQAYEETSNEKIDLIRQEAELQMMMLNTTFKEEENQIKKDGIAKKKSKVQIDAEIQLLTSKHNKEMLKLQISAAEAELKVAEAAGTISKEKIEQAREKLRALKAEFQGLALMDEELAQKKQEYFSSEDYRNAEVFGEAISHISDASTSALGEVSQLFDAIGDLTKDAVSGFGKMWDSMGDDEKFNYISQKFAQLANGITAVMDSVYENRIQRVEEEQEMLDEESEKELERIQKLADNGAISEEEAEARKRAAEDKTAKKQAELEKKKAELQTRQAKWNKANNLAQTAMATALGIMQTIKSVGFPAAIPLVAMVAAMGALQLAAIAAQPIPKYAKGTDYHKGGLAIVGDGGVSETIITDKGVYKTPNVPTLVDLPKAAKVIPYALDMEYLSQSMIAQLPKQNNGGDSHSQPIINVHNDNTEIGRKLEKMSYEQKKVFKELTKVIKSQNYKQFAAGI